MKSPTPNENNLIQSAETVQKLPGPVRCLSGSLIAGGLALPLYFLTTSISQNFASKPIHSHNPLVVNIGAAVRSLVLGMSTLATAVFGFVAIGLLALAVQVLIQQITEKGLKE